MRIKINKSLPAFLILSMIFFAACQRSEQPDRQRGRDGLIRAGIFNERGAGATVTSRALMKCVEKALKKPR